MAYSNFILLKDGIEMSRINLSGQNIDIFHAYGENTLYLLIMDRILTQ